MTRLTFVTFFLLTGFFYVTGKPVDQNGLVINSYAELAKQKVASGLTSTKGSGQQMKSGTASQNDQPQGSKKHSSVLFDPMGKTVRLSRIKTPDVPVRNPRRVAMSLLEQKKSPSTAPATVKTALLSGQSTNRKFGEARNKFTGAAIKPLVVSYRQRYVKTQKPVLGPRLTAVLLKRELRRIGCFSGNITSKWDNNARAAIQNFNTSAGSSLATQTPTVATLERLQQIRKTVCVTKPADQQQIIANAAPLSKKAKSTKKYSAWRTKVKVGRTAYRPATNTKSARRNYRAIGRPDNFDTYKPISKRHARRTKAARKHRAKRAKRIRMARAKKRKARRRTAVRSWKRTYRRKRFGFRRSGGSLSLDD